MSTAVDRVSGGEPLEPAERPARPYGLLGLVISLVLILAGSVALTVLVAAIVFAVAGLALGWHQALARLSTMSAAAGSEGAFVARAGVALSLLAYAALSVAVLAAARLRGGRRWRDLLGWRPWHPLRNARLFWIVAIVTIAYGFGADALVSYLYPPSQDWITLPPGAVWAALFIVLAIVFAPITEELLFRGWLYTGLRPKIGIWGGILLVAVLFALAHWEKTHLYALIVFPVGVALGFVREKTGSLIASMAFHALFNGAASVALLLGK